jgi:hypothetical protein
MAIPFKLVNAGANGSAYGVFKINFTTSLSDIPTLSAWDEGVSLDTTANTIFVGTAINTNKPMMAAISGIPNVSLPVTPWFPSSGTAGNSNTMVANFLNGVTNGIKLAASSSLDGANNVFFNLAYKFPSDVGTLDLMSSAIACTYQYTGGVPTTTFYGNDAATGTESTTSPGWTALVPVAGGSSPTVGVTSKIQPCDIGKGSDGDGSFRATIPSSGSSYPGQIWVKLY